MTFLISSITPVIIFLYLVYHKDHVKEPLKLLLYCFLGGFLAYTLALLFELIVSIQVNQITDDLFKAICSAFLNAALPEELAKFSILYLIIWKRKNYDHYYSGITYAVFVSMGLALIENLTYVYYNSDVAFARAVLAVPGHGFNAVIMGYYFSIAKFGAKENARMNLIKSLGMPIVFHGSYDFILLLFSQVTDDGGVAVSFLTVCLSLLVIRLWRVGIRDIKLLENS